MNRKGLPLPDHFDHNKVRDVWRVPYQERADQAEKWAKQCKVQPAVNDKLEYVSFWSTSRTHSASLDLSYMLVGVQERAQWTITAGSVNSSTATWM